MASYTDFIKRSAIDRKRYGRNIEANRYRARVRKQRILIERAIAAARVEIQTFGVVGA